MIVSVIMGTWAIKYTGKAEMEIELCDKSAVSGAVKALNIPEDQIGMVSVNNKIVGRDYILRDGDELKIFQPIIGG